MLRNCEIEYLKLLPVQKSIPHHLIALRIILYSKSEAPQHQKRPLTRADLSEKAALNVPEY